MMSTVHTNRLNTVTTRPEKTSGLRACLLASVLLITPFGLVPADARGLSNSLNIDRPDQKTRMLVEADQMIYDYDRERVSAVGNVQIYYGVYALEADKVTYDQSSARLVAEGNVRLTEPGGNIVTANYIDITDDFRTGFVRSLRVQTPEKARFAAESAERPDDDITIFDKGVYTTCEPCRDNPKKSPLWQIKASRIIYNSKDKMVYYRSAKFEFLGVPLLYTPYFAHPDPSRQRATGFLLPSVGYDSKLGAHASIPYYWALTDNYDVTFTPAYYTKQGLLASATWRHHLEKGQYEISGHGIFQQDPKEFVGTSGDQEFRGAIESKAEFALTKQWKFGWDVAMLSDKRFLRDYNLTNDDEDKRSTLFLVGQGERNYFDARANYYNIMTDNLSQGQQAIIHPSVDYSAYSRRPILGGEGRLKINSTTLTRNEANNETVGGVTRTYGLNGNYNRTSVEASWKRKFIAPGGQVITPFTSLRGDFYWMPSKSGAPAALVDDDYAFRGMPTVGIDYRLPILAVNGTTSHIIEPIAQIIVSPNETHVGAVPNDDAHSLIFDDSILFDPNKFSGYDRVEGGTRANLGFQYRMQLASGWSFNALAGRSYHLAGRNSFSQQDLTSTGLDSGLDKNASDYVARVGVNANSKFQAVARGRFDAKSADLKYAAIEASGTRGRFSGTLAYSYTDKRPSAGIDTVRQELSTAAAYKLNEYWTAAAAARFDMAQNDFVEGTLGLKYDDECFAISLNYSNERDVYTDETSEQKIQFRLDIKSIGGGNFSHNF